MDFKNLISEFRLLKVFYVSSLLGSVGAGLTGTLIIIYFLLIGFSPLQISIFVVAGTLSSLIFEIPTGAFADHFGRKMSVIVSCFGSGFLFLLVPFVNSFTHLVVLFALVGFISTFRSGADKAWFIDFIKYNRKQKMMQKFLTRLYSINIIGAIPGGIIASLIMISFASPSFSSLSIIKWLWIIEGFLLISEGMIYLLFGKELYFKQRKTKIFEAFRNTLTNSMKGLKFSVKHETIFLLTLSGSLFFLASAAVSLGWQQYLKQDLHIDEIYFGFVGAFLSIPSLIAFFYVERFVKRMKHEKYGLALLGIVISFSMILQAIANSPIVGLIAFGILFALFDFRLTIFQKYFNDFVPSKTRATILSVNNMFASVATLVGSFLLYGLVTEIFGLRFAYIISAVIMFASALILLAIKSKVKV